MLANHRRHGDALGADGSDVAVDSGLVLGCSVPLRPTVTLNTCVSELLPSQRKEMKPTDITSSSFIHLLFSLSLTS